MKIKTALELADSYEKSSGKIPAEVWALRVLAGAYRRQQQIADDARSHMQAMEGMLASCRDRGDVPRESANAIICHSRGLRRKLK